MIVFFIWTHLEMEQRPGCSVQEENEKLEKNRNRNDAPNPGQTMHFGKKNFAEKENSEKDKTFQGDCCEMMWASLTYVRPRLGLEVDREGRSEPDPADDLLNWG